MSRQFSAAVPESKAAWLEKFFRFGFVSKGIVYCLLGILTVMAAAGLSGKTASKEDAFGFILEQPFGRILLAIVALGLFGFVTLRIFQSFKDIDNHGDDAKGIFTRIGYAISALIYLSLGLYAMKLVLHITSGNTGNSKRFVVAKVLDLPAGAWIIGLVAVIVIVSGGYQIYKGVSKKFMKKIQLIGSQYKNAFQKAGVVGFVSRGIVLLVIGYLLLHGAIRSDAGAVQDTEGAFSFIENKFGAFLMGVIAAGLVAYGVFMFIKARYERISVRNN